MTTNRHHHDITSRAWGHAPELRPGVRAIYWTARGWRAGVVEAGPRMLPRRHFQNWRVRPRGGRARWISCVNICSALPPRRRLPA